MDKGFVWLVQSSKMVKQYNYHLHIKTLNISSDDFLHLNYIYLK